MRILNDTVNIIISCTNKKEILGLLFHHFKTLLRQRQLTLWKYNVLKLTTDTPLKYNLIVSLIYKNLLHSEETTKPHD